MSQYIPEGVGEALPELWDTVVLNDKKCPGVAKVSAPKRKWKWDDKKAKGSSGAERNFNGIDPVKFTLEILLTTEAEHEEFKTEILPFLDKPVGDKEKPESIKIGHAATDARKVSAFSVDDLDGPDKNDQNQVKYTVACTEYRAPSAKNATGGLSAGGTTDCGKLNTYLNSLYAQQIAKKVEIDSLTIGLDNFTIDAAQLKFRGDRIAQLEAERVLIGGQIIATISQMNALGCPGKPPANDSLKGP